jgi:hypothetical protein
MYSIPNCLLSLDGADFRREALAIVDDKGDDKAEGIFRRAKGMGFLPISH